MPDTKNRWRIALLALAVLAVHLWLLAGMPRFVVPQRNGNTTWVARTVTPPAPQPETKAPEATAATKPRAAVAPPPPAPRKQEAKAAEQRTPEVADTTAPKTVESGTQVAERTATPPAPEPPAAAATRESGASPALRFRMPPSARFNYDLSARQKGFPLSGSGRLDWRNDGHEYEARLTLSAPLLPTRVQHSTGLVTAQGLAPVRFSNKVRSEEAVHFDRERGKVVFSTNKPEAVLEPGVQDRLSIILQLGAMLAGEPSRYPAGSHITVQVASTQVAEPWTFTVQGSETLALPGGRVQAVRLTREPRKEYDVKVELWLAPGAAYAPVRLRLTQPNGDWVDQQWSSTDRG
ncbi:DUF3108 domain-containing protein [Ramlibacter sp. PS4R-6]|uniref:DUF3108 domain-containing protein n=1 Tax=Ramlibacter sp. PS4R-6 TaxID=3133438 RepID=UPI00309A8CDF